MHESLWLGGASIKHAASPPQNLQCVRVFLSHFVPPGNKPCVETTSLHPNVFFYTDRQAM